MSCGFEGETTTRALACGHSQMFSRLFGDFLRLCDVAFIVIVIIIGSYFTFQNDFFVLPVFSFFPLNFFGSQEVMQCGNIFYLMY